MKFNFITYRWKYCLRYNMIDHFRITNSFLTAFWIESFLLNYLQYGNNWSNRILILTTILLTVFHYFGRKHISTKKKYFGVNVIGRFQICQIWADCKFLLIIMVQNRPFLTCSSFLPIFVYREYVTLSSRVFMEGIFQSCLISSVLCSVLFASFHKSVFY